MNLLQHKTAFRLVFICSVVSLFACSQCEGDTINIVASVDGDIESDGTIDDSSFFSQSQIGGGGIDTRIILEFDLGAIPVGATINSASFSGHSTLTTNGSEIELQVYVATSPFSIAVGDYSAAGIVVADNLTTADLPSNGDFTIALTDISTLQLAADSTNAYGLRAHQVDFGDTWRLSSLEGTRALPTLSVDFSTAIPEPGSAGLGLAVAGLFASRRRRDF